MVKKGNEDGWREATVLLRADILNEIERQGWDLAEECNLALANRYGIDYRQEKIPVTADPHPVIIAQTSVPPQTRKLPGRPSKPATFSPTPVLNAEDPRIAKALKSGEISWQRPQEAPQPARASQVKPEASPAPAKPEMPKQAGKPRKEATPSRRKKEDPIKKFISSMVIRDADPVAVIMKDAMYAAFERWCRDKKFIQVPPERSFSIALKNQLAVSEKNLDGLPAWINVSLK
jgi:hypothetical protein